MDAAAGAGNISNRMYNRERVLRTILQYGGLPRVELARQTGLTPAAISNITRDLIDDGFLQELGALPSKRVGAQSIILDLTENQYLIGVAHQGVSSLRIGLATLKGKLAARTEIATPDAYTPDWAANTIAQTWQSMLQTDAFLQTRLAAAGVGIVGLVDADRGIAKHMPRIGWENVPFAHMLEERLNIPIALDNNVRGMAIGETIFGKLRAYRNVAFVYIGTGIGSGIIIEGNPYHGSHGGAGEIGHVCVDPQGEQCYCGNRGCLETTSSEIAILRRAVALGIITENEKNYNPKEAIYSLARRAHQGDPQAVQLQMEVAKSIGIALANMVDLLNPSHIALHGIITESGSDFLNIVRDTVRQHAFLSDDDMVHIVPATFGSDAGLIGAAAVALDSVILKRGAFLQQAPERASV